MSRVNVLLSVLVTVTVTVCCMLSGCVAQTQQVPCVNATAMANVNISQFVGTWYEVARSPNLTTMGCVEIDLGLKQNSNSTLGINVTYVDPQQSLWKNSTFNAMIDLNPNNTAGYNVSYSAGSQSQPQRTIKLLNTDYKNYALVCGYTNASNDSTSFAVVLTRVRMPAASDLTNYEQMGNKSYTNFNQMTNVVQSNKCYAHNSASAPLPLIATVFAAVYALVKFVS